MRSYALHVPAAYSTENDVPVPLVLDFHGWGGTAHDQMVNMPWRDVADIDPNGFLYVAPQGMDDNPEGGWWGSWNVSKSEGPLGMTCDPTNPSTQVTCYSSCPSCDKMESCDWSSCYDDVVFIQLLIEELTSLWCIDIDSVHITGASNGGMFIYTRVLAQMAEVFATVAPVCGAPLLGFNELPTVPVHIIDFHGLKDETIPHTVEGPNNHGEGPYGTVESSEGWYYYQKPELLAGIREEMTCSPDPVPYTTHMDGVHGWSCWVWFGCTGEKEVVACTGDYGHDNPFHGRYIEGVKIQWDFMKTHKRRT